MPENQARPGLFLNGKQVQLLSQAAMIAALGFFEAVEICIQLLLRVEARPVDALHLRIAFLPFPVSACDAHQLERANAPGRRNMRPAAEVYKFSGGVERHHRLDGALLHQFALEALIPFAIQLQRFGLRQHFSFVGNVLRRKLAHLLFDALKIFGRERLGPHKIVEKSGIDRRADAQLDVGEKFHHRCGEQVRRRVAKHLDRFGIFRRQDCEPHVLIDRRAQIDQKTFAVWSPQSSALRAPRREIFPSKRSPPNSRPRRLIRVSGRSGPPALP